MGWGSLQLFQSNNDMLVIRYVLHYWHTAQWATDNKYSQELLSPLESSGLSLAKSSSIYFKLIQESESRIQRDAVKLKRIDEYSSLMQISARITSMANKDNTCFKV